MPAKHRPIFACDGSCECSWPAEDMVEHGESLYCSECVDDSLSEEERVNSHTFEPEHVYEIRKLRDGMETAWAVIANAGQGSWERETEEWRDAAELWRDEHYHRMLRNG